MPNTLTNLIYHIIFSTKNRAPLIQSEFQSNLYSYIGGIAKAHDCTLLEIGGISDHVHLLVKLRANISVADLIRLMKANASKWVNEQVKQQNRFAWQTGYGAFTVSASQIALVRNYVRRQAEHHRIKTFQEELVDFFEKNGIEYDPRYLWN